VCRRRPVSRSCDHCGEPLIVVAERLDPASHSYGWAIHCLVCEARLELPVRNVLSVSRAPAGEI
jgi:hypothetical protein